jgi:hypothetical protein
MSALDLRNSLVAGRSGPSSSYPAVGTYLPGSALAIACQAPGQRIHTTSAWDKFTDGTYVTDYQASTPNHAG